MWKGVAGKYLRAAGILCDVLLFSGHARNRPRRIEKRVVAEDNGRLYNVSFSNKARYKWLYVLRNNTEGLLIATTFRMNYAHIW